MKTGNARVFFFTTEITLSHSAGHLHTHIEHGLSHLDVLPLQESLGIRGEVQSHQGLFILCATQGNTPIGQFDDFQEGCGHGSVSVQKHDIVTVSRGHPQSTGPVKPDQHSLRPSRKRSTRVLSC